MEKKLKLIVTALLIIVILISCILIYTLYISKSDDKLVNTPYTNTEYGWSINYPVGWDISEGSIGDADFIDKSLDDILLNIRVEPLQPTTLDEEIDLKKITLENASNGYYEISQRNRVINNMDSYEFIYRYEEQSGWIKTKLILIEKDSRVFEIKYNAGINSYDKYESLAEKCINTFKII